MSRQASSRHLTRRNNARNETQENATINKNIDPKQARKTAEAEEQRVKEQTALEQSCGKRFQLGEKIGEGTYGIVYKAIDFKLNQVSNSFNGFCILQNKF
jgi:serine/threonine protein kinase